MKIPAIWIYRRRPVVYKARLTVKRVLAVLRSVFGVSLPVRATASGALFLILPFLVTAQTSNSLSGPNLGFVFDGKSGVVRPLLGIAGSATVGDPIDLGFPVTDVLSLPDQHRILVVTESGFALTSIDLEVNPPVSRSIPLPSKAVAITLSPNGSTAALAFRAEQLVEVVAGLPDHPVVAQQISTSLVQGSLQRVVVNDSGSTLLMTFLEGDRETVYRWTSDGFRLLAAPSRVGALAFVAAADAVYADSSTSEVFLVSDAGGASGVQFLAGPSDGISGPAGVGTSTTGGFFLANSISHTVTTFDANHRILRTLQCDCNVSGLYPLTRGIYRLTAPLNETIYLLDNTKPEERLVFVPPLQ